MQIRKEFFAKQVLVGLAVAAFMVCGGSEAVAQGLWIPPWNHYKIKNMSTNHCLRPVNGSSQRGARITMDTCANSNSRYWQRIPVPGGFLYKNYHSKYCLTQNDLAGQSDDYTQETCNFPGLATRQQFSEMDEPHNYNAFLGGGGRILGIAPQERCLRSYHYPPDPPGTRRAIFSNTCDWTGTRRFLFVSQ